VMAGIATILAAKLFATVFLTRLFQVCRAQLVQIHWFARLLAWITATKDRLYARVRAMPAWAAAVALVASARTALRQMLS
ncbi:MAG: hypothetical protein HQL37_06010, partial [Alphaproteobacteria bacterium]|nr:hypothetical protein [Alphaproteobacteria bacterium]